MQVEKDLILREVQRITSLLTKLIEIVVGAGPSERVDLDNIDSVLKIEFDLSIRHIMELEHSDMMEKIKGISEIHIENLIELLWEVSKRENHYKKGLIIKCISMLDFLDTQTNTFSFYRLEQKNKFKKALKKLE